MFVQGRKDQGLYEGVNSILGMTREDRRQGKHGSSLAQSNSINILISFISDGDLQQWGCAK